MASAQQKSRVDSASSDFSRFLALGSLKQSSALCVINSPAAPLSHQLFMSLERDQRRARFTGEVPELYCVGDRGEYKTQLQRGHQSGELSTELLRT